MKISYFISFLLLTAVVSAQTLKKDDISLYEITKYSSSEDKFDVGIQNPKTKSPGLAMIYSLVLPGAGHLYTNRFDVGKYFLIAEAGLWLGYAGFSVYGDWLEKDAQDYAQRNAGVVDPDNKDEDYWINIGIFNNVEEYNNLMLSTGQYEKVYYPGTGMDFYWNNDDNRRKYREDNLASERIINDRKFIAGALIINHLVSAISALIVTNKYNKSLTSGGLTMTAGVQRFQNKVHGIKLNLSAQF